MSHGISSLLKRAVLLTGMVTLLAQGEVFAERQGDSVTPSLQSPAGQANVSSLSLRLQAVKKDLEIYLTFAEHFNNSGETKTVAQLQAPLSDYLTRHVNNLLTQAAESSNVEAIRLAAEIMYIKTCLLMALNQSEEARAVIDDMKKVLASYQKITVQIPGKTTTLDEAILQLDNELTKTTAR
ncbi:MAG: hypothetical protein H6Q56_1220 [Deltaproteobacteria bacterium]|nr:hypothetical protein [Deltaproteobacteria bacterium]